ncbi:uncharacterized protein LOC135710066 [Ochlerotatus camptorhynchus]|uniref:uncharacterized protein LOC135710066 n=1 Tax=Ochlerotatus camptorhynchus TaxID=644619 RepID=UPI0031E3AE18
MFEGSSLPWSHPDDSLKAWEDHASTTENRTYDALIEFLHRRIRVRESVSVYHAQPPPHGLDSPPIKCYVCEQRHPLVKCMKFEKMSAADRLTLVNVNRLCLNCFRSDHFSRNCPSRYMCRFCKRRHHSLLHSGFGDNPITSGSSNETQASANVNLASASDESTPSVLSAAASTQPTETNCSLQPQEIEINVFLLTAIVVVVDRYGKEHLARALLDCESQPYLITEKMAQLPRLKRSKTKVLVQGIGPQTQNVREYVHVQIRSRKENFSVDADFLILPKVTPEIPVHNVPVDHWNLPPKLFLADPQFHKRVPIDMIQWIEHFFSFFQSANRINLPESLPTLIDSVFGWLVSGSGSKVPTISQDLPRSIVAVSLFNLEESIERFWKVEELPVQSDYSLEEKQCEELFSSTTSRDPEGRYMVHLPRRSNSDELIGYSKSMALNRFNLLERRLERNPELKEEYHKFMAEYLSLGHMRRVQDSRKNQSKGYYLPHHPVVKEASTTTKVRVVFDASSKTSTGFSLNEALLVGPVVQDDLLSIILRFRTFLVALVSDIAKMYRQVLLHPDDTLFQRILWRFSQSDPIEIFELMTVTYGLSPSFFLATRTLQQLAIDEGSTYSLAGPNLVKNFYVDDFIGGAQTIEDAVQLRTELSELLKKGGFELRKWTSNQLSVLSGLSSDEIGTQSSIKFEPIIIRGKMLMQRLWLLPCGWDDEVPYIASSWEEFAGQIPKVAYFRVSRYALLHTFSDASESAYGAFTYARCVDSTGKIRVELLACKSRVAPLKKISLPRLELCAADVAAKLHSRIVEALQISITSSLFWSDSTVTLQWLRALSNTWKTFVDNRVSEIQSSTNSAFWNHIAGKDNPADLVSRGMHVDDFLASEL